MMPLGRWLRDAGLAAALLAVCLTARWCAADPAPFRAFTPGHETELLALIAPWTMDGEVAGARLTGLQVASNHIAWEVRGPAGEVAQLRWTARTAVAATPQDAAFAASASFAQQVHPWPPPPALLAALRALAKQVQEHDRGGWVARLTQPIAPTVSATLPPDRPQRPDDTAAPRPPADASVTAWLAAAALLWTLVLAALAVSAAQGWRALGAEQRGATVAMAVLLTTVAAVVRWLVPPTLLHCNNHGIEDLGAVLGDDPAGWTRLVLRYGPAFFGPQAWLARLTGGTDTAVFAASVGWGAAATLLTALAAWQWSGLRSVGLAAGLWMAVLPLAVRVGHSESTLAIGQCVVALVLLGMAGVRTAGDPLRRRAAWVLLLAALVLLAAGHTFGPGYAVALWVMGAEVALSTQSQRPRWHGWLRWLAVAALPVAVFALLLLGADGSNRTRLAAATLSEASPFKPWQHLLWLDPDWTPWAAQALLLLGGAALLGRGPRLRWLTLPLGLGLLCGLALFIGGSLSVGQRYQSLLAPPLALLAGHACVPPQPWGERGTRAWQTVAAALAITALASTALNRTPYVWQDLEAQVFAALEAIVPQLPDRAVVLVPDREGSPDQEIVMQFPGFLGRRRGRHVTVLHDSEWQRLRREAVATDMADSFVWRSPHCQASARVVGRPPEGRDGEGLPLRNMCAPLERLAQQAGAVTVASGRHPPPNERRNHLPEEYHVYSGHAVIWRLVRLPPAAPPP